MLEEILHGHRFATNPAPFAETLLDSIVKTQHASVHLFHHDARGRDDFCKGSEIEDRGFAGSRRIGVERQAAKGPPPQRVCAGSNVDRRGRKDAARERVVKNVPRLIERSHRCARDQPTFKSSFRRRSASSPIASRTKSWA